MKWKRIAGGLLSYTPLWALRPNPNGGNPYDPDYSVSIFFSHYNAIGDAIQAPTPETVVEFGCGFSLGTGICWLLTGTSRLYALDMAAFVDFKQEAEGLPRLLDALMRSASERLKGDRLTRFMQRLEANATPERLNALQQELRERPANGAIQYHAPWNETDVPPACADLIYSQVVLQHLGELDKGYEILNRWLKPGGVMSHHVDYTSLGTSDDWNGHWALSDFVFGLMQGRRPCITNRQPHQRHIAIQTGLGLEIKAEGRVHKPSAIERSRLAPRFRDISDEDLNTECALIVSTKPN